MPRESAKRFIRLKLVTHVYTGCLAQVWKRVKVWVGYITASTSNLHKKSDFAFAALVEEKNNTCVCASEINHFSLLSCISNLELLQKFQYRLSQVSRHALIVINSYFVAYWFKSALWHLAWNSITKIFNIEKYKHLALMRKNFVGRKLPRNNLSLKFYVAVVRNFLQLRYLFRRVFA